MPYITKRKKYGMSIKHNNKNITNTTITNKNYYNKNITNTTITNKNYYNKNIINATIKKKIPQKQPRHIAIKIPQINENCICGSTN